MENNDRIAQLKNLVSLFSANIAQYKSGQYDEANTRTDFIDKFFSLLDWDVANNQGWNETYREVVREDKVKIDGSQKAPDYSFRIGGARKFFVEAKKPSVNIKEAVEPAYQVRRYAYTAKLPLSILTDFEEFAVYDTRIKPNKNDKAGAARIFYCTYDQYEQHFDFIYNTFSKNAILKGSFDKYVDENKNKKGTSEVDEEILALVEEWRVELAKNIAKNNNNLSVYDLNTVVQKIIDRIIFLRIAEDKGIEDENLLLTVAQTSNIYEKLILLFIKANEKYNSGLFANVDWINKVQIKDEVLSKIIVNLYYPECPYEFSVLPVEILGSIYERFLGKTIRFRNIKGDAHTAIVEEKPEVKKAGGVFYTPQYIVDYIVHNTVGEKIKNKTPEEITQIKICDPACGSGSFLVGTYQYLLNYHLEYYVKEKNVKSALKNGKIYEEVSQSYNLTIEEKQRILISSIFGVDIDSQAVEVTKLSLYLKLLENEGSENKDWLFKYSHLTLLPSLEDNIKCGNSLIGTDYYTQGNFDFSDDDRIKVNCFDWESGFSDIFKAGGFDVVIGNPPYGAGLSKFEKAYLSLKFPMVADFETSQYFIAQSHNLHKTKGYISFIIPNTILVNLFAKQFRNYLNKIFSILKIADLSNVDVFSEASVRTTIPVFSDKNENNIIKIENYDKDFVIYEEESINQSEIGTWEIWDFHIIKYRLLLNKIKNNAILLNDILEVSQGLIPYDKYRGHNEHTIKNRIWHADYKKDETYKKELRGADVKKYSVKWNGKNWISYGDWLAAPRKPEYFIKPRILIREITDETINAAFTEDEYYNNPSIINCIERKNICYSLYFVLGVINSKLIAKYHTITSPKAKKGLFPKILVNDIRNLPIPSLNFSKKADKAKHDNLVSLVDKMLELKQKEAVEQNEQSKTMISRQIEGIDKAIDTAVYGLYGLSEDEIKVVEG